MREQDLPAIGPAFFTELEATYGGTHLYLTPSPELTKLLPNLTQQDFTNGLVAASWFVSRGAWDNRKAFSDEVDAAVLKEPKNPTELAHVFYTLIGISLPHTNSETSDAELANPVVIFSDPAARKHVVDAMNIFFGFAALSRGGLDPFSLDPRDKKEALNTVKDKLKLVQDTLPFHFYGDDNDLFRVIGGLIVPSIDSYFARVSGRASELASQLVDLTEEQRAEFTQRFVEAMDLLHFDYNAYQASPTRAERVKDIHPTIRELCDEIEFQFMQHQYSR